MRHPELDSGYPSEFGEQKPPVLLTDCIKKDFGEQKVGILLTEL